MGVETAMADTLSAIPVQSATCTCRLADGMLSDPRPAFRRRVMLGQGSSPFASRSGDMRNAVGHGGLAPGAIVPATRQSVGQRTSPSGCEQAAMPAGSTRNGTKCCSQGATGVPRRIAGRRHAPACRTDLRIRARTASAPPCGPGQQAPHLGGSGRAADGSSLNQPEHRTAAVARNRPRIEVRRQAKTRPPPSLLFRMTEPDA
jgi:hypothetical protein